MSRTHRHAAPKSSRAPLSVHEAAHWAALGIGSPLPLRVLRDGSDARLSELLGPAVGQAVSAIRALLKASEVSDKPHRFDSSEAVFQWARSHMAGLLHEELWLLALTQQSHLRSASRIAQGGDCSMTVSKREVMRHALIEGATACILVHNHPSGDPTPSDSDVHFTRAIEAAGVVLGIPLIDHIVISGRQYRSFLDLGLLPMHDVATCRHDNEPHNRSEARDTTAA